ncbi:hypothetical protein QFZ32_004637 [Streptomyces canus]|nr:hypothetical protein [Streptomyces canus]
MPRTVFLPNFACHDGKPAATQEGPDAAQGRRRRSGRGRGGGCGRHPRRVGCVRGRDEHERRREQQFHRVGGLLQAHLAAVDIWHCDALGIYSGYESSSTGGGTAPTDAPSGTPSGTPTGEPPSGAPTGGTGGGVHQDPTDDERYLRGTWKTDKHGQVTFRTIFPGWYRGRCVHIHTKVHVNGEWTDAGYEGGNTCHTGQFFFDEESVLASAEVEPYSTSTTERTTLTEDTIYDQSGTTGGLLKLKYNKKNIAKGVIGSLTMGVDPEATNDNN